MKQLLFSCLALTLAVNGTIHWTFDLPRDDEILEICGPLNYFDRFDNFRKFRGVANLAFNLEGRVSMLKSKIDEACSQKGKDPGFDDEQLLQNTGINYGQYVELLTNASRILTDIVNSCDQASSNLLPTEWPSEEVSAYVKKRKDWAMWHPYGEFHMRDYHTGESKWVLESGLSDLARRIVMICRYLDRWSQLGFPATEVRVKFHDALRRLAQFAPSLEEELQRFGQ